MKANYFENAAMKYGAANAVIAVLRHKKLIEWSSCAPNKTPLGYNENCPPVIQWRFINGCKDLEDRILPIINQYSSEINWVIRKTKYNDRFRMLPKKVWDVYDSFPDYMPLDAAGEIEESEPVFGVKANQDALKMAAYLDENL